MVNGNSYAIIRFKTGRAPKIHSIQPEASDLTCFFFVGNPGIWLFHCHIEWHIEAGLVMTFVEDPIQMQALNLTIPQNFNDSCAAQGIPTRGNAGGDTVDWYNSK